RQQKIDSAVKQKIESHRKLENCRKDYEKTKTFFTLETMDERCKQQKAYADRADGKYRAASATVCPPAAEVARKGLTGSRSQNREGVRPLDPPLSARPSPCRVTCESQVVGTQRNHQCGRLHLKGPTRRRRASGTRRWIVSSKASNTASLWRPILNRCA